MRYRYQQIMKPLQIIIAGGQAAPLQILHSRAGKPRPYKFYTRGRFANRPYGQDSLL